MQIRETLLTLGNITVHCDANFNRPSNKAVLRGSLLYSSFSVKHEIGNVGIFVLFELENKLDVVIIHVSFISKHQDKCTFVLKFIEFIPFPMHTSCLETAHPSVSVATIRRHPGGVLR